MIQQIEPQSGKESVWDYPRPPRVEASSRRVRVIFNGETIADSIATYRVLETSHPPVYYIPQQDINMKYLTPAPRTTFCEFKGMANYWTMRVADRKIENAAWCYADPRPGYAEIQNYIAFYPDRMDACYLDDELVQPQAGDFYGGWITSDIAGPFKGGVGSFDW
ncbi:MAG TPA: DUF427 domain-containing protein [Aggregatilineales bacterium]|nr:DUF427 domain-containing protein [Aggregatilineales bacterium]